MDYKKFNNMFDVEGLKKDMEEAGNNKGEFKEVPVGDYEVVLEKLELTETKDGKPMLSCWMKILVGEYTNSRLFYNQVLNNGFGLYKAKQWLLSLESGEEVEFDNFEQFAIAVDKVFNSATTKHEYLVELSQTVSKGKTYNNYQVKKVYDI